MEDKEPQNNLSFIAKSPAMIGIKEQIPLIAKSPSSVFITGESGTGKEVVAASIHHLSQRRLAPFIKINCAAVPETLIESEFFGHEKGSFTGADKRRAGRFELANQGTLLLDEVTEIPLEMQAKLLRAIQEREFERVGGSSPIKVDVRLISTSNRSLEEAVKTHILREDLYYRLNVIPIHIPPLRERKEDIAPLIEHFLKIYSKENHRTVCHFSKEALRALEEYPWPGNVRELANLVERAVVLTPKGEITADFLFSPQGLPKQLSIPLGLTLKELEERYIVETLRVHGQDAEEAAKRLGLTPDQLRRLVDKDSFGHNEL